MYHNYPYTDFHELNLDWFLNKFKSLLSEWEKMKIDFSDIDQAFKDLKEYVENYFDNLDVQEEINNKLDEMYESGELALILSHLSSYRKNVTFMGVDNTGATDASETLYAAFQTGGCFYLPAGTYLLEHQLLIPSNVDIKGDGTSTILLASPDLDAVYHTVCSENASDINARLCRNTAINGYPDTTLCDHYVENVRISDLKIDGNWRNRDLETWNQYYSHDGYNIARERGTNLELQRVRNVIIDNVTSVNGLQHNINVRAAAFSYGMGWDYEASYPSYDIHIQNCYTNNQRYDDGITTHDSEYIWIDNCIVEETANIDGSLETTISNNIEIDDGSRFVTVSNCISRYGIAGYQAKGHKDTPAAHDISFENCTAMYTSQGFVISCSKTGTITRDTWEKGRCYNIELSNCNVLYSYPLSNVSGWAKTVMPLHVQNVLNLLVSNFTFDPKRPDSMYNMYNGDDVRTMFNFRDVCYNVQLRGMEIPHDIIANYDGATSLFNFSGACGHIVMKDIKMKGYTGTYGETNHPPILRFNNNSVYNYLEIDGLFAERLNDYDRMLWIGSGLTHWSQIALQGTRKNMIYYNLPFGVQDSDIYGFEEDNSLLTATGSVTITPNGNVMYGINSDLTVNLNALTNIRLYPFAIANNSSGTWTVTVNHTPQNFTVTKELPPRDMIIIYTSKSGGLYYE